MREVVVTGHRPRLLRRRGRRARISRRSTAGAPPPRRRARPSRPSRCIRSSPLELRPADPEEIRPAADGALAAARHLRGRPRARRGRRQGRCGPQEPHAPHRRGGRRRARLRRRRADPHRLRQAADPGVFLNERLMGDLRPTLFLAQLSNLLAGNISIVHGVTGASRTFMGEEPAGVDALRIAQARIASGQNDIFLVGGAYNAERPDVLLIYEMGGFLWKEPYRPVFERAADGGGIILGQRRLLPGARIARARATPAARSRSRRSPASPPTAPGAQPGSVAAASADLAAPARRQARPRRVRRDGRRRASPAEERDALAALAAEARVRRDRRRRRPHHGGAGARRGRARRRRSSPRGRRGEALVTSRRPLARRGRDPPRPRHREGDRMALTRRNRAAPSSPSPAWASSPPSARARRTPGRR